MNIFFYQFLTPYLDGQPLQLSDKGLPSSHHLQGVHIGDLDANHYCQSELRQTWASFQKTFKVWPWWLEELSVVATASIYSAPPWCADIVSSPRWSNNFAPACEESWQQGAKKHWDTWMRSIMMPCLMSIDSTGPPESQSILPFQRVPERLFTSVRTIRLIGVPEFLEINIWKSSQQSWRLSYLS